MQSSARARADGDEETAQVLLAAARWHRFRALHPELDEVER
jgi:hypothetical protein